LAFPGSQGAYYYGDAYPQGELTDPDFNLSCCTKTKLMDAKKALDADRIPINYLQLDDWSVRFQQRDVTPGSLMTSRLS
jgi:hypothetical protein